MEKKLAIVIPYYKKTFFKAGLQSLQSQTDKRFTVYIGNDNSPENPEKILEEFRHQFDCHYHKFDDNLGSISLSTQWERCISLCKDEDWIMVLGDDDVLENNLVEEFYKNLNEVVDKKINVIRFSSQLIDENGETISPVFENPKLEKAADSYIRAFRGEGRSTLTEHIFRSKSYEKHGFKDFPVGFGSDIVAWLEFPEMGNIFSINSSKAYIRISPEHLSSKKDPVLDRKRKEGIYRFNRYIIDNYAKFFAENDQQLILEKTFRYLKLARLKKIETLSFILFSVKTAGIKKTYQMVKKIN